MPTWRERRQIYSSMSEIIGYARVRLENLRFQHPWSVEIKRPDPKRIQKMLKVFRAETCLNCELDNFIDALLPTSCKELLADTPGSDLAMLNHEVYCLYGLHRTFAAREYLDPHEQWWTVRLYRETLPKPCIVKIREKFSHEQKFSDGEIFRKILYYHMIDIQPREEAKWWARLTTTKRDDLKQLLKTNDFEASFGKFILYPGLWDSIQLGSLHRLLTLKCYEEVSTYLKHLEVIWKQILGSLSPVVLDCATVEGLEGLCPLASYADRAQFLRLSCEGKLFASIEDADTQREVLERVNSVECLIPSFGVMFESLISLEPCCIILKELIMPDHLLEENSIERGLIRSYEGVYQTGKLYIQASEHQKWQQPHMNLRHDFRLAYIQLWLFCLRYFPYLGRIVPRIEPNKKRREKIEYEQSPRYWQMLGSLALDIGFFNERIRKFSEQDVVDKLTKSFLLAVRPDHTHPPEKINRIKEMVIYQTSKPLQVVSGLLPELTLKRRIGRLFDRDFEHGKSGFFLPNILGKLECERGSITILHAYENLFSSFFRLKDLPIQHCSVMDDTMMNFSDNVDEFIPQLSSPEGLHEIERQRDENKRLVSEISEVKEKLQASTTQLKVEQQKLKKFGEQMEDTRDKHSRELQRLQQTIEQRNIIFQDELRIDLSKQDAERQKNLEITHQQALRQVTSENNGLRIAAHNMRESEVAAVSDMKDELAQLKVTNQIKQKRDEEKRRTEIAQVESENDKLKDEAKKVKQDLEQLKLDNRIEKMQREDTHMKAVAQIRSDNAALIKTSFTAPIVYDQGLLQMVEGVFAAPPSRSVAVKYWRSTTKSVDTPGAPVKADADLNTIAIMHRLNDDDYNHFLEDFRVRIKNEKNYRLVTARDRIELHVTLGTEKTQPWTYARYADVERFEFPQNIVENMVAYKAIESKPNAPSVLKRRRRFSDQLELEFVELRDEVETKDEQEEREVAMASQSKGQILGRKRVVGKEYRQSLRSVQPLKGRVTALASKENLKKVRSYGRPTKKSKEPEKSRQAIQEDDPMLETTSSQIDAVFNQFSSSFTQFDRSQL